MQLKSVTEYTRLDNSKTFILSALAVSSDNVFFDVVNNGEVLGNLALFIHLNSCQIVKFCCVGNIDFTDFFSKVVDEIVYEFPEITTFWVNCSDLCGEEPFTVNISKYFTKTKDRYVIQKQRIAVTALKPSDGGIHFGHYFGNIKPLVERQDLYNCVFVFADLQLLNTDRKYYIPANRLENIKLMLRQLIALGVNPQKTKIILESQLKEHALPDFITISDFTTDARIFRNPYIKAERTASGGTPKAMKMSVLNYPIMETLDFYLTNADVMFSNMDNKACVEFTNELYQKMNSAGLMPRKKVKLIHGFYDYLPGIDGKKMSKSNNNAIYFLDSCNDIRKKVNKMYTDPNRISADIPGTIERNVVFQFLRLFLSAETFSKVQLDYEKGKIKDTETKEMLATHMSEFILSTQKIASELDDEIINTIIGDVKI